jgi:hypothetical protein
MAGKAINRDIVLNDTFGINPGDDYTVDTPTHVSLTVFPFPGKPPYQTINNPLKPDSSFGVEIVPVSHDKKL